MTDNRPTLTDVTSSNVAAIGHDGAHLWVQFHSRNGNSLYMYHDVPAHLHDAMLTTESAGKFLHAQIKDKYKFTRIE